MLEEYMLSLGYSKEDVEAFKTNYSLERTTEKTLANNIKNIFVFFSSYNYNEEQIIKMTTKFPSICSYSLDNIKSKMNELISLGYTEDVVLNMIRKQPSIIGLSKDTFNKKINEIKSLG